jgi:hypothetical protein
MAATPDLTCLDGVLGLANCACPCLEQTAPEGWNTSASGLYLADLIPLDMADSGHSCDDVANPWNILDAGRRSGAAMFMNDFRARLAKRAKKSRETYKGRIGEETARTTITPTHTYAGAQIPAAFIRGGYVTMTIGGVFSANGTIDVQIYDRFNVAVGAPIVLTTIADKHVTATVSRKLPLWTDQGQQAIYWAVYEVNPANLPKAIRVWCPTCQTSALPVYNSATPYWGKPCSHRQKWVEWFGVAPWEGDTLTDFDLAAETLLTSNTGYTNGLTFSVELTCDPASVICLGGMDYSDPAVMSAAYAYYYAAAICDAEMLLRNTQAMRSAAVTDVKLAEFIPTWQTRYNETLDYAVYQADLKSTDCVVCKPAFQMKIQGKTP